MCSNFLLIFSSKPKTYKIEKTNSGQLMFQLDGQNYPNLAELIAKYRAAGGDIYLEECLPPSEYGNFIS
jgi:hypothetical protein